MRANAILRVAGHGFAERLDRGVPLLAASLRHAQCHPCAGIVGFDGDESLQQLQRLAGVVSVTEGHAKIEERTRVVGVALQGEPQGGDAFFGVALLQMVRPLLRQGLGFVGLLPADDHPVVGHRHFRRATLADKLPDQMFADRLEVGVALKLALIFGQLAAVEVCERKLNVVGSVRHQSVV